MRAKFDIVTTFVKVIFLIPVHEQITLMTADNTLPSDKLTHVTDRFFVFIYFICTLM